MKRRDVLLATGGLVGVVGAGQYALSDVPDYEPLGSISVEGAAEAVVSDDGSTAYLAASSGFVVVDVSDPAEPTVIAEERALLADRENGPLQQILDVKVDGDTLLVVGPAHHHGDDALNGMLVYDVSDPSNPRQQSFYETEYAIHNAFVLDDVAYLTKNDGDGNPVVLVDISDRENPVKASEWSILERGDGWGNVHPALRIIHDVWVQDGLAYLPQWDAGTWIVDVSNPADPEYVTDFSGVPQSEAADVPNERAQQSVIEPPGNDHYVMADETGDVTVVGVESWRDPATESGGPGGVHLWDTSNLDAPEKLATIEAPETPDATMEGPWTTSHNFDIVDGRLYTSWYQGGVKIHDISDPANPEELSWWRQPEEAAFWTTKVAERGSNGFFVASNYANKDDIEAGLYTFPDLEGEQPDPPEFTTEE